MATTIRDIATIRTTDAVPNRVRRHRTSPAASRARSSQVAVLTPDPEQLAALRAALRPGEAIRLLPDGTLTTWYPAVPVKWIKRGWA